MLCFVVLIFVSFQFCFGKKRGRERFARTDNISYLGRLLLRVCDEGGGKKEVDSLLLPPARRIARLDSISSTYGVLSNERPPIISRLEFIPAHIKTI